MKKNKFFAMLLCSTLVFTALTGCSTASSGTATANTTKKPQLIVGVSFQNMDNPYFITMNKAAQEEADLIGAKLIVTDANSDVSKQTSDVEDMIQKGVKILLLNPTDSKGIETAVNEAKKAGITVVTIDAQANGPVDSFVGSKNYDAGLMAGEQMGKDLKGTGKVAILNGIPVVPILDRVRGFEDAMKKYPGIKIVDNQNGKEDRATSLTVTENLIQKTPDLNAIFSVNDTGALGSVSAVTTSKKNIGIYSVDGNPEAVKDIVQGNIFKCTVAQYPRDEIRIGFGIALAKYLGATVPKTIPVDVKLLTKANAKGFAW